MQMILEAISLTKTFGDKIAVNNVDFSIERGSFVAFLGPNGAGKSTTIQMLLGLLEPTAGKVHYPQNVRVGVVFQQSVLDDVLTVRENLVIRAGQYPANEVANIDQLIHSLGMQSFENQRYGTLSGGQKRRVDIARALLNRPEILFLDEPTTGLDIQTRTAIWELMDQIRQETGMTMVLTTHYLDETHDADQVFIIDQGKILAANSAKDIIKQHSKHVLKLYTADAESVCQFVSDSLEVVKEDNVLIIRIDSSQQAMEILKQVAALITDFEFSLGTMNDAFMALTGKEMR